MTPIEQIFERFTHDSRLTGDSLAELHGLRSRGGDGDEEIHGQRGIDLEPEQFRQLFSALSTVSSQPVYYYAGNDAELLKQQQAVQARTCPTEAMSRETTRQPIRNPPA